MLVGEARGIYSSVLREYNMARFELGKQKEELKARQEAHPEMADQFSKQAATLELQYNAVDEKYKEYQEYMNKLMEQWNEKFNSVVAEQQGEAAEEYFSEMSKILAVVRRMMKGGIVPGSDEKKVMDFDKDLYTMAKEAQTMAQMQKKKHEKYDSLWEDEEKKEYEDPMESADAEEAFAEGPEVVAVEDTMTIDIEC